MSIDGQDTMAPQAPDNTEAPAEVLTPGAEVQETTAPQTESVQGETANSEKAPEKEEGGLLEPGKEAEKAEEETPKTEVPEKYEDFTMPEGFQLSGENLEKAATLFRELGLDQAGAQKAVDAYIGQYMAQKANDDLALAQQRKAWREQTLKSPTFNEDRAYAQRGMNALVTEPDEIELFRGTWLSDNPALFRIFTKVGKLISEDAPGQPPGGRGKESSAAEVRFPKEKFNF